MIISIKCAGAGIHLRICSQPPAQICFFFFFFFWHIQIVSWLILWSVDSIKPNEILFLQIRSKPHLEDVWDAIQIRFLHILLTLGTLAAHNGFPKSSSCHPQHDTLWRQIQRAGSALERISWHQQSVEWTVCSSTWQCDCLESKMMDRAFVLLSLHIPWRSDRLQNNIADTPSFKSYLIDISDLPAVSMRIARYEDFGDK